MIKKMRIFKVLCMSFLIVSVMSLSADAKDKKYKNGSLYSGEWKKGKPNGQGVMTYPNGVVYVGTWYDGQPMGEGKITTKEKKFEGSFTPVIENEIIIDFKPETGTYSVNGIVMTGDWGINSFFNGEVKGNDFLYKGTLDGIDASDGNVEYKENSHGFVNGVINGVMTKSYLVDYPAYYNGTISDRNFIGEINGKELSTDIREFNVSVDSSGKMKGKAVTKDLLHYDGEMKNGKLNGNGKLYSDYIEYEGIWEDGILIDGTGVENFNDSGVLKKYEYTISDGIIFYTTEDDVRLKLGLYTSANPLHGLVEVKVDTLRKAQEEAIRERERKAQIQAEMEKTAKEIDNKYLGMKFMGKGGFLTGEETGLVNALFGSSIDIEYTVSFMPGGKVTVYQNFKSRSSDPMIMAMSAGLAENSVKTYKAKLDGDRIVLGDSGLYVKVSTDKKSLRISDSNISYILKII